MTDRLEETLRKVLHRYYSEARAESENHRNFIANKLAEAVRREYFLIPREAPKSVLRRISRQINPDIEEEVNKVDEVKDE